MLCRIMGKAYIQSLFYIDDECRLLVTFYLIVSILTASTNRLKLNVEACQKEFALLSIYYLKHLFKVHILDIE